MNERPQRVTIIVRRILMVLASLTIGAFGWFLLGESETLVAEETPYRDVLATVDGISLTQSQVEASIRGELVRLERRRHALRTQALEAEMERILVGGEAARRGISRQQLIEIEVEGRLNEVPLHQIEAAYAQRHDLQDQPFEAVADELQRELRHAAWLRELEAAADIAVLTEPFRVEIEGEGPSDGPADAPITIVEFSDFRCPACRQARMTIEQIRATYGDSVRVVYRHAAGDRNARQAGELALCAAEQDRFWQMHDILSSQPQASIEPTSSGLLAGALPDLDRGKLANCLTTGSYSGDIEQDITAAQAAGVSQLPAFFVNGRYLESTRYERFSEVIDDELKRLVGQG